jgi:hypothetical protein
MSYLTNKIVIETEAPGAGVKSEQKLVVRPHASTELGPMGTWRAPTVNRVTETFPLLPAASVAAGTSPFLVATGTGTDIITADVKGGVNLKTQATTPTAGDNVLLSGVANTPFSFPVRDTEREIEMVINLTSISDITGSFGLNENVTDPDPAATAGDGVALLADPDETVTTGLTAAQHANWIVAYKVNGADTYAATDFPLVAGRDFHFRIAMAADYTCAVYINETLVGTSPALTAGDTVKAFLGLQTNLTDAAGQRDFTTRLVSSDRIWK